MATGRCYSTRRHLPAAAAAHQRLLVIAPSLGRRAGRRCSALRHFLAPIAELKRHSGSQFDPVVVATFLKMIEGDGNRQASRQPVRYGSQQVSMKPQARQSHLPPEPRTISRPQTSQGRPETGPAAAPTGA